MAIRIQLKRDTRENWVSKNPILLEGEIGIEQIDEKNVKIKFGNGKDSYISLPYFGNAISYPDIFDKPIINGVEIVGDLSLDDLGIQSKGEYALSEELQNIITLFDEKLELKSNKETTYTKEEVDNLVVSINENIDDKVDLNGSNYEGSGLEEIINFKQKQNINPFSLLDYKWSEYELSNASWLISNGAFYSGAIYTPVYELLLKLYNGEETKEGVNVKLVTEEYTDTDFVLNTDDTTFRLPLKVKLASGNAVVGNGMTLGLMSRDSSGNEIFLGFQNYAGAGGTWTNTTKASYGTEVGSGYNNATSTNNTLGVTSDPEKSGIETSSSGLYLYFYVGETIQDVNVINASEVLSDIANLKGYDYVVESYNDDGNWYRLYKSGWIEQGGFADYTAQSITITLLKPMANTKYNISVQDFSEKVNSAFNLNTQVLNITSTSFDIYTSTQSKGSYWRVCGQKL